MRLENPACHHQTAGALRKEPLEIKLGKPRSSNKGVKLEKLVEHSFGSPQGRFTGQQWCKCDLMACGPVRSATEELGRIMAHDLQERKLCRPLANAQPAAEVQIQELQEGGGQRRTK